MMKFNYLLILSNSVGVLLIKYFIIIEIAVIITLFITFMIINYKKNKTKGIKPRIDKGFLIAGIIISALITIEIYVYGIVYILFYPSRVLHIEEPYEVYGDYLYQVVKTDEDGNEYESNSKTNDYSEMHIRIVGLSEEGKAKEILIIPQYINGIEVKELGSKNKIGLVGQRFESDVLKRIYVPFKIDQLLVPSANIDHPLLERIIVFADEIPENKVSGFPRWYVTSYKHIDGDTYYSEDYGKWCNVSYMYNYTNASNHGYYWVDDYDYGKKIRYKPIDPVRDGYIFAGWYKEAECINQWDFDSDTLPDPIYNIGNYDNPAYQETILYAKWIKED